MLGMSITSNERHISIGSIFVIALILFAGLGPVSATFAEDNLSRTLILENVMFNNTAQKNIMIGIRNPGDDSIEVDCIYINNIPYTIGKNISSASRMEIAVAFNWIKGERYSIFAVASNGDYNGLEATAPNNISKFHSIEGIIIPQSKENIPSDALLLLSSVALIILILGSLWSHKDNPLQWYKYPLGLPAGSIRAVIALLFVMTILLYGGESTKLPEWLTGIVGTIIGFYFGDRTSEKGN